jgi:uncharacterized protein (TIGR01244 family)
MNTTKLSPKLAIASQPDLEDFADLAQQGYGLVINNRPDGEDFSQPGSAAEEQAARVAGLAYLHLPVGGAPLTEAEVRQFQDAVADSEAPVLAHCKSGTRSLIVWAIGEVLDGRMKAEDLRPFGQHIGFDLRGAEAWLAQHRAG